MKIKKLVGLPAIFMGLLFTSSAFAYVGVNIENLTKSYTLVFTPQYLVSKPLKNCADWDEQPSQSNIGFDQFNNWKVDHSGDWCGINEVGSDVALTVYSSTGKYLDTCDIEIVGSGGSSDPEFTTSCNVGRVAIVNDGYSNSSINPHYKAHVQDV